MMRHSITTFIISIVSISGCTNDKSGSATEPEQENDSIIAIELNLLPAFNNHSIIAIDKSTKTVQFRVDTTIKSYQQGNIGVFSASLDSFRANAPIDSFYSQTFLDSIKSKPNRSAVRDGLSIYTVVRPGNISDTIESGNVYPKILSLNIILQIDYIFKTTKDKELKKYLKDLKEYFH
jgi:hypothetical protein